MQTDLCDKSVSLETLEVLVRSINEKRATHDPARLSPKARYRRLRAVKWMNQIIELSKSTREIRDTSVQILDKFTFTYVAINGEAIVDSMFFGLAAATSLILAAKLHDSKCSISKASFPCFRASKLAEFERLILNTIQFDISPCHTPTVLIQYLLNIHPAFSDSRDQIITKTEEAISEFWVSIESSSFTSVTVALSTLVLAFNALRMDRESVDWIKSLPHTILNSAEQEEIDRCLQTYGQLEVLIANLIAAAEDCKSPSGPSEFLCRSPSPSALATMAKLTLASPVAESEDQFVNHFEPIEARESVGSSRETIKKPLGIRSKATIPEPKRQKINTTGNEDKVD